MAELKNAAGDIQSLCEAILYFSEDGLKKFNYSIDDLKKSLMTPFIESLKAATDNIFSDEQVVRISEAMTGVLKKVFIEVNSLDDAGKVEILVRGINLNEDFDEKVFRLDVDRGASQKEIAESITHIFEEKFKSLKPLKTNVFTVDCEYLEDKNYWLPIDMKNFLSKLMSSATEGK